jgi:hypothetical protein
MTSQGATGPLNAWKNIDAARACLLHGNVRITAASDSNEILSAMHSGDAAIYKYIDFGEGIDSVNLRIKSFSNAKLLLSAGKPWHHRLALKEFEDDELGDDWQIVTIPTVSVSGVDELWIQAYGDKGDLFEIDWFRFK